MKTRAETRDSSFGHILQCDIDENLSCIVSIRKNRKWFYLSIEPEDIDDPHLRGQYERRASACRRQQIAYQQACDGEDGEGPVASNDEDNDSGYSSEEPVTWDGQAEDIFQEWIQQPLAEIFEEHAPGIDTNVHASLQEWYAADIFCFSLKASQDDETLQAEQRDDLDADEFLQNTITPNMKLPKYLKERKSMEWYSPADIEVLAESHDVHMPMHPTVVRVRVGDDKDDFKTCFLKLAAKGQEPAVKRELKLLADIKANGLFEEGIRAPVLEGLVTLPSSPSSHEHILGFLLSLIPQPCRPLTKLMSCNISEAKRKSWARGVEQQVAILHKHKLLWGDAKADNFLVDRDDKLWIIDFGGSYTMGWMDPRKYGTYEGEDEAVRLIVNGVRNPDHCPEGLIGDTDEAPPSQSEEAREVKTEERRAKRKSLSSGADDESHERAAKRRTKAG